MTLVNELTLDIEFGVRSSMKISYNNFWGWYEIFFIKNITVGFDDVVKVINSHKVIEKIPVREGALKIALNPRNNDMYVTNAINNTVSVIG